MQSVYVRPEYRKKGVFRALFNHIEQLARNRADVKALRLYVMQDNQSGKNTYEALGMRDSQYIVYEKRIWIKYKLIQSFGGRSCFTI